MYEAAADVLGRDIRYGKVPEDRVKREAVKSLHDISNDIAFLENKRTEFEEKDLAMFPRAPLAYRGRRMRKSDVRTMNRERRLFQEHENMRMILSTLEAEIASGCDRIETYFESNLETGGE